MRGALRHRAERRQRSGPHRNAAPPPRVRAGAGRMPNEYGNTAWHRASHRAARRADRKPLPGPNLSVASRRHRVVAAGPGLRPDHAAAGRLPHAARRPAHGPRFVRRPVPVERLRNGAGRPEAEPVRVRRPHDRAARCSAAPRPEVVGGRQRADREAPGGPLFAVPGRRAAPGALPADRHPGRVAPPGHEPRGADGGASCGHLGFETRHCNHE